jgi:hypothetical protein
MPPIADQTLLLFPSAHCLVPHRRHGGHCQFIRLLRCQIPASAHLEVGGYYYVPNGFVYVWERAGWKVSPTAYGDGWRDSSRMMCWGSARGSPLCLRCPWPLNRDGGLFYLRNHSFPLHRWTLRIPDFIQVAMPRSRRETGCCPDEHDRLGQRERAMRVWWQNGASVVADQS